MHELSLCQSLLRQVAAIVSEQGSGFVSLIELQVGELSGVEPALMQHAFPVVSQGSIAQGARLLIQTRPLRVLCERCGSESDAEAGNLSCRACGNWQTRLISGDELLLTRIEIESSAITR